MSDNTSETGGIALICKEHLAVFQLKFKELVTVSDSTSGSGAVALKCKERVAVFQTIRVRQRG